MVVDCCGYACLKPSDRLEQWSYQVRDVRPNDCLISIKFCGLCHTDLHMMKDEWRVSQYPMVPGHEVAGEVIAVGEDCKRVKVGDSVGVGYIAWSCRTCEYCKKDMEQLCPRFVQSYGFAMPDGEITRGGFADKMVCPEEFAVIIPTGFPLEYAAPLLCAGVTCWSPMRFCDVGKPGTKIGIIGLGGLGHMAVKFGVAMGNEVTVLSSSGRKKTFAASLGATRYIDMSNPEEVASAVNSLDFILNTVAAEQDVNQLLSFLKPDGSLVAVGLPEAHIEYKIAPSNLVMGRKKIIGSIVGSIRDQDEMMSFCAEHDVKPMIEVLPISEINTALDRLEKNDVKFRFVLALDNTH